LFDWVDDGDDEVGVADTVEEDEERELIVKDEEEVEDLGEYVEEDRKDGDWGEEVREDVVRVSFEGSGAARARDIIAAAANNLRGDEGDILTKASFAFWDGNRSSGIEVE